MSIMVNDTGLNKIEFLVHLEVRNLRLVMHTDGERAPIVFMSCSYIVYCLLIKI